MAVAMAPATAVAIAVAISIAVAVTVAVAVALAVAVAVVMATATEIARQGKNQAGFFLQAALGGYLPRMMFVPKPRLAVDVSAYFEAFYSTQQIFLHGWTPPPPRTACQSVLPRGDQVSIYVQFEPCALVCSYHIQRYPPHPPCMNAFCTQRLAFSRLLTNMPSTVFLDEATSALDETNEAKLYAWLNASGVDAFVSVGHRASLFRRAFPA